MEYPLTPWDSLSARAQHWIFHHWDVTSPPAQSRRSTPAQSYWRTWVMPVPSKVWARRTGRGRKFLKGQWYRTFSLYSATCYVYMKNMMIMSLPSTRQVRWETCSPAPWWWKQLLISWSYEIIITTEPVFSVFPFLSVNFKNYDQMLLYMNVLVAYLSYYETRVWNKNTFNIRKAFWNKLSIWIRQLEA